ncbi:concanavalin A-like lectin/glucanase [Coprinopsis marcescibilis]|uniref:Concanavalin A-like lectin/glucanase n=1 Tax=Coprinopsis marcescibilis TaxID=230819 RepID=A0A5C3L3X0_COPMA|nr:concanavalin A-like lectin/glucanase [Coprinopsis marcescibilis]
MVLNSVGYGWGEHSSSSDTNLLLRDAEGGEKRDSVLSQQSQIAAKFSLPAAPQSWGFPLTMDYVEADDDLHNPDLRRDKENDLGSGRFSTRGLANVGCLFILGLGIMMLFAGYPVISYVQRRTQSTQGGFNLGGINATGQIPVFAQRMGLIDPDTPLDVYTKPSYTPGRDEEYVLVFSDEFNVDDRSFYPGDDPYWEAVNLHYWVTNDLEWYDPAGATTSGGALRLTLDRADPESNHDMEYVSGMIQSWNKFCFTGGILEASIQLPGSTSAAGLWPALWAMGNLGRAGHGATTDGMWPYSYDSCDVGTLPNQTYPGTELPRLALEQGDPANGGVLSYLPGQRLSACTCPGESHPGPMRRDGTYVGRAAPEIDVLEALVEEGVGKISLSAQWAPYNAGFNWTKNPDHYSIYEPGVELNEYQGGVYQQTTSCIAETNQGCYEEGGTGCYAVYAFEYKPGFDDAYITWVNDNKPSWTLLAAGMGADARTEISDRPIPVEPMYIIANLGFSLNFGNIDFDILNLPATMSIDYIRVYQPKDQINIGCDPKEYPTRAYIETYMSAYTNPNLTTWEQTEEPWPRNREAQPGRVC